MLLPNLVYWHDWFYLLIKIWCQVFFHNFYFQHTKGKGFKSNDVCSYQRKSQIACSWHNYLTYILNYLQSGHAIWHYITAEMYAIISIVTVFLIKHGFSQDVQEANENNCWNSVTQMWLGERKKNETEGIQKIKSRYFKNIFSIAPVPIHGPYTLPPVPWPKFGHLAACHTQHHRNASTPLTSLFFL